MLNCNSSSLHLLIINSHMPTSNTALIKVKLQVTAANTSPEGSSGNEYSLFLQTSYFLVCKAARTGKCALWEKEWMTPANEKENKSQVKKDAGKHTFLGPAVELLRFVRHVRPYYVYLKKRSLQLHLGRMQFCLVFSNYNSTHCK